MNRKAHVAPGPAEAGARL